MLVVEGVRKAFGQRLALDDVTLKVEAGRFVALLGPNGAGKTTLFQLMTGLFTGDGGHIAIAGHDIDRDPVSALANVGIVFQEPTLDLDLTVEANLMFHARLQGLAPGRTRERIAEQAARLGIADRLHDRVRTLSGGNRRRVELARALLHEPPLLLMDEPTVGLDPASRRDMLGGVIALKDQHGTAVLWATHLVDEAEQADTVVVLHLGRVLFTGPPADLSERTASASLADAFIALTGG